jgi:hypothetical protein
MTRPYRLEELPDDQVAQAFPVVQTIYPRVEAEEWRSFVGFFNRPAQRGRAGVLCLRDASNSICGILAYRLDYDLHIGPVSTVQPFLAVDLVNSPILVRLLLEAAESRALAMGCRAVQIRLAGNQHRLAAELRALGLAAEPGVLSKPIDGAAQTH